MGNEPSQPERRGGGSALPSMVLIIDEVVWQARTAAEMNGQVPKLAIQDGSGQGPRGGINGNVFCTVAVDGTEIGRATSYPSHPIKIPSRGSSSKVSLRFVPATDTRAFMNKESSNEAPLSEVVLPLIKLIRYGAPLYTSMWLGLPTDGGDGRRGWPVSDDVSGMVLTARSANASKVAVTLFRPSSEPGSKPSRSELSRGMPVPDVRRALMAEEDSGLCGADTRPEGPSGKEQVQGVIEALRAANATTRSLQVQLLKEKENAAESGAGITVTREVYRVKEETSWSVPKLAGLKPGAIGSEDAHGQLRMQMADMVSGMETRRSLMTDDSTVGDATQRQLEEELAAKAARVKDLEGQLKQRDGSNSCERIQELEDKLAKVQEQARRSDRDWARTLKKVQSALDLVTEENNRLKQGLPPETQPGSASPRSPRNSRVDQVKSPRCEALTQENADLKKKLGTAEEELVDLRGQLRSTTGELGDLRAQLEMMREQHDALKKAHDRRKAAMSEEKKEQASKEVEELRNQVAEMRRDHGEEIRVLKDSHHSAIAAERQAAAARQKDVENEAAKQRAHLEVRHDILNARCKEAEARCKEAEMKATGTYEDSRES
eukprot:gnl/TRDRNA2_/TRDRNA2_150773_c0_seq1.p1 gnl/TRDRNA2_/TRDRNA2_150773_c0~~gnl/TRDRNA2_/TRDRNA2_150773_c0_seq1.p1  ORF type:complete len:605 (+),score=137.73 gnl/TRDRNA2_/TRDRNA2_150773_c0_seq1:77-1891(+)